MTMTEPSVIKSGPISVNGEEYLYEVTEGVTGPGIYRVEIIDRDGYEPLIVGQKEWSMINIRFGHEDAVIHFVKQILEGTRRP